MYLDEWWVNIPISWILSVFDVWKKTTVCCMPSFLVWTFEIQNICALGSQNIKPMQVLILRNMGEGCGFPWRIYVKNQKEQVSELSPNSHDIILFCLWIVSETPGSFSTIYVYHIFAMYIFVNPFRLYVVSKTSGSFNSIHVYWLFPKICFMYDILFAKPFIYHI